MVVVDTTTLTLVLLPWALGEQQLHAERRCVGMVRALVQQQSPQLHSLSRQVSAMKTA